MDYPFLFALFVTFWNIEQAETIAQLFPNQKVNQVCPGQNVTYVCNSWNASLMWIFMDNLNPSPCTQHFVPSHKNVIGRPHSPSDCNITVTLHNVTNNFLSSSLSFIVSPNLQNASIDCEGDKRIIHKAGLFGTFEVFGFKVGCGRANFTLSFENLNESSFIEYSLVENGEFIYDDVSTNSNIDLNLAFFNNYTISSQYVLCESYTKETITLYLVECLNHSVIFLQSSLQKETLQFLCSGGYLQNQCIFGDFITDANDACNITMAIVPSPTTLSNQTTKVFSGARHQNKNCNDTQDIFNISLRSITTVFSSETFTEVPTYAWVVISLAISIIILSAIVIVTLYIIFQKHASNKCTNTSIPISKNEGNIEETEGMEYDHIRFPQLVTINEAEEYDQLNLETIHKPASKLNEEEYSTVNCHILGESKIKKHPVSDYSALKFENTERKHIKTCEKSNTARIKYNTEQDSTLPEGELPDRKYDDHQDISKHYNIDEPPLVPPQLF